MKEPKVLDIETTGSNPWTDQLLCVGWDGAVYDARQEIPVEVRAALADPEQPIISHTKYDARFLRLQGWEVTGPYFDTQVMAWVINENTRLDLDYLALRYAGTTMDKRIKQINKVLWFIKDDKTKIPLAEIADDEEAFQQLMDYCQRDIDTELTLYHNLRDKIEGMNWYDYWMHEEVPYTEVLLDMECAGLPINLDDVDKLHARLEIESAEQNESLLRDLEYEVNLNSGTQLAKVLFEKVWYQADSLPHGLDVRKPTLLKVIAERESLPKSKIEQDAIDSLKQAMIDARTPIGFVVQKVTPKNLVGYWVRKGFGLPTAGYPKTESKERWSTSTPDLMVHHSKHPWVQSLVKYRKVRKILTTYTGKYHYHSHNGRLYGRFNQTGTKTGRLSSSGPNLQNQPAHGPLGESIRSLFQGKLIVADYSQLEPRLMAHFSGDPVLMDTYKTGKDIYLVTASLIFGEPVTDKDDPRRQVAKTYILALGYGAGPPKLQQILALNGFDFLVSEVKEHFAKLQSGYSVFFDWKQDVINFAHKRGFVKTIGGRMRRLGYAFADSSWKQRGYGERQAVNAVIQGSAGDVVRRAQIALDQQIKQIQQLAQIHDELIFDAESCFGNGLVLKKIQEIGETAHGFKLDVPLVFEPNFCNSWADKGHKGIILPDDLKDLTEGQKTDDDEG